MRPVYDQQVNELISAQCEMDHGLIISSHLFMNRLQTTSGHTTRICDGLMDCHDFSDEVACNYCPEGQVHCGVGAACIDVNKRCDGFPDCPNGSDERGCRELYI
jgi:hypothetical protein